MSKLFWVFRNQGKTPEQSKDSIIKSMFPNLLLNPDFDSLGSLYDYLYDFWLHNKDSSIQTKINKKRFQFIAIYKKEWEKLFAGYYNNIRPYTLDYHYPN